MSLTFGLCSKAAGTRVSASPAVSIKMTESLCFPIKVLCVMYRAKHVGQAVIGFCHTLSVAGVLTSLDIWLSVIASSCTLHLFFLDLPILEVRKQRGLNTQQSDSSISHLVLFTSRQRSSNINTCISSGNNSSSVLQIGLFM